MKNNNPFGILPATTAMKPGQVYLANEGAVGNEFLSQALTQYSVGWTSPDGVLEKLLEDLAGAPITVGKRFAFKAMDNAKAFAAAENDEDVRAIGADFKRIKISGSTVDSHTVSKGLTLRIDRDELNDDPEAEQKAVAYLRTILLRAEIIRALAGLTGVATNTAKTWGAGDGKADADADVMAMLNACADASGLLPNTVLFGSAAWQKRFLTLRDSANSAVAQSAVLTLDQLAALYGVRSVKRIEERFQAKSGKQTLLSNNLVLAYNIQNSGIKDDPSNIKRFVTKVNGADYAVFREEKAAGIDITVAHQSRIIITSGLGIGKLTIS